MYRRRNYLIKKKFQFSFVSKFIVLLLIESILIIGLFMTLSQDTLTTGYHNSMLTIDRTQRFFLIPFALSTLIIVVGIGMAGMVVFTLLSHRIAGPMYRIEKALKQMEGGDLTATFDLRKADQLTECKEALNTFMGSLDARLIKIRNGLMEVQSLTISSDDPESRAKLNEKIKSLLDEINHFKLSSENKA